jgi:hypothetical protein
LRMVWTSDSVTPQHRYLQTCNSVIGKFLPQNLAKIKFLSQLKFYWLGNYCFPESTGQLLLINKYKLFLLS